MYTIIGLAQMSLVVVIVGLWHGVKGGGRCEAGDPPLSAEEGATSANDPISEPKHLPDLHHLLIRHLIECSWSFLTMAPEYFPSACRC